MKPGGIQMSSLAPGKRIWKQWVLGALLPDHRDLPLSTCNILHVVIGEKIQDIDTSLAVSSVSSLLVSYCQL